METIEAPSRAARSRQILAVLTKHGFAAAGAGLTQPAGWQRDRSRAEHARLACEELGTTFIKLGQILSARADLLPPEYRAELAKLQDDVAPIDYAVVARVIEDELGFTPDALFATFEQTPMASASIGQVHLAQTADGRIVVVKVRKPEVLALVERDLEILGKLVAQSEKYFPALADYDLDGMLEEFADTLRAELDYGREARNIATFASIFAGETGIDIPEVVPECSSPHVLTMTYVGGSKVSEPPMFTANSREAAARRVAQLILEPALMHGLFYADPHPGNILLRSDGSIGVVDFGMVARLSQETRRRVADLFLAMQRRDVQRLVDRLFQLAPPLRPVDRNALGQRLLRLLERYLGESLERVAFSSALDEMLEIIRDYGLRPPPTLAMLFKSIAVSEGVILAMLPGKSLSEFLEPIAQRVLLSRLSFEDWAERAGVSAMDVAELSIDLPRRADRVLADVEQGNLRVWAKLEDLEPALGKFERLIERANATMIAAACIVGITVLFVVYHPQGWQATVAWIFWIAFLIAVLTVFRTAWATFRTRR